MQNIALVAIGGAVGSVARYLVGIGALRLFGPDFPVGTLAVNIVGSFLMGVFIELVALKFDGSPALRLLIATGFLGGFTTFSAFSLDVVGLWERGAVASLLVYLVGSVVFSILALFAGLVLVRAWA